MIAAVGIPAMIARSALAGATGTVAMDLLWYARYRRGGGQEGFGRWEFTHDVDSWEDAPAPGRMARKLIAAVSNREVPVEHAAALSNVMHWAYPVGWTAAYALFARRRSRSRRWPIWYGPALGSVVWSSDYVTLPLAGVYEPIWRYETAALYQDLSAHVVFGAAADAALRVLPDV